MAENLRHKGIFKEVFWRDARDQVQKVNPDLCKHIDALSPGKNLPLFLASYPFGENILQKGIFQLPNKTGQMVSIND